MHTDIKVTTAESAVAPDDRQLLDCWVGEGDRAALEQLLQRWYAPCYRVATRIAPHDAADAVQEGFLSAMRSAAACRGAPGAWLIGIVANAARKALRGKRRGIPGMTEPAATTASVAATQVELPDADVLAVVRTVLAEIPEHERMPLLMRFADGLEPAAIAARHRSADAGARRACRGARPGTATVVARCHLDRRRSIHLLGRRRGCPDRLCRSRWLRPCVRHVRHRQIAWHEPP